MSKKLKLIYEGKIVDEIDNPGNMFVKSFKFPESGEGWHTIYFAYIAIDFKEMTTVILPIKAILTEPSVYTLDKHGPKIKYTTKTLTNEELIKLLNRELKW